MDYRIVTYKSGRKEEFECKIRADGAPNLAFKKKIKDLMAFLTVINVRTERFSS